MILAELMNRSLRTPRDLERQLQIRPIVSIPNMRTEMELRRSVWMFRALVLMFVAGVPLLGWLVDQYYLPLPVLAERVVARLGLDGLMGSLGL
jgi:hypothetical protein